MFKYLFLFLSFFSGALHASVTMKKGVSVIVDFADFELEDYNGTNSRALTSETELRNILDDMESHWKWMSNGVEEIQWDIIRIKLDENLTSDAFSSSYQFRNVIVNKALEVINIADYDYDNNGQVDTMWALVSSNDNDPNSSNGSFTYLEGGASANGGESGVHNGAEIFIDVQSGVSVIGREYGNFNHEVGHNFGLPDLYGDSDNLGYLSLMSWSWGPLPTGFSAWERIQLGWLEPQVITQNTKSITLYPAEENLQAIRISTESDSEYFLIEYRQRPESGYGSTISENYDGLAIYHVLESQTSNNNALPQKVRLEAVDGDFTTQGNPTVNDFWYPENPIMPNSFQGKPYYTTNTAFSTVFELSNIQRTADGGMVFDIDIFPTYLVKSPNLLLNGDFELEENSEPESWVSGAWLSDGSNFTWLPSGGVNNSSAIKIENVISNDAWFEQSVSGLIIGENYILTGDIKVESIEEFPTGGANIAINGTDTHSKFLQEVGEWQSFEIVFTADTESILVGARLGFWGGDIIGSAIFDNLSLRKQTLTVPELLINGDFELGNDFEPESWESGAWLSDVSEFTWFSSCGVDNSGCIKIENSISNDAWFEQSISALTVGGNYILTGDIKVESIELSTSSGANIAINGTWTHSSYVQEVGEWQSFEVVFTADSETVLIGARLGFWDGEVIGSAFFDNLSVKEQFNNL